MFSYEKSTRVEIESPHKSECGNKLYIRFNIINLAGDCSSVSLGQIGCNAELPSKQADDLCKAMVHFLTAQYAVQLCCPDNTWKFLQTGPDKYFTNRGFPSAISVPLFDEVARKSHIMPVVAWTGRSMEIRVWEVKKDLRQTPPLKDLPKDLAKYTYKCSFAGGGDVYAHGNLKITTEENLRGAW
jgi:hypothetical protein